MTNKTVRALAAALLLGAAAATAAAVVETPAVAATIKTPAVAKLMKDAQAAAKSGNWRGALEKAQAAQAIGNKTPGEASIIEQFIAYAATQAGQYSVALTAYDHMIASGAVNRQTGLETAMRLALRANNPAKALQYANELGGAADPMLVAQLYFQQQKYADVIRLLSPQLNAGSPSKDALVLLQNSYYRTHNNDGVQRVLEVLALHYPTADSWHEIIKTASQTSQSDRGLLELYRIRLAVGDLRTHDDFFEMAEVTMAQNLPAEAKAVLDKGVALKLLAGDRDQRLINLVSAKLPQSAAAEAQLRQQAAANPGDGNADITLAEILWTEGKFADAEQAARLGIKEGNLRDPDLGKIVLGHALLSQGKRQDAASTFAGVSKTGKLASVGHLWSLLARAGVSAAP